MSDLGRYIISGTSAWALGHSIPYQEHEYIKIPVITGNETDKIRKRVEYTGVDTPSKLSVPQTRIQTSSDRF